MQRQPNFDARQLIHTPAEAATAWANWAKRIKNSPGSTWGIPSIDAKVIPERPGELICILGRPGDGKSSLLAYRARREAALIREDPRREKDVVVYVTWESSIEELQTLIMADPGISASDVAWGRAKIADIERRAAKMPSNRVWFVGRGIERTLQIEDTRHVTRMTPEVVFNAIEAMKGEWGVKPSLMLFDYMQLVPTNGRNRSRNLIEALREVPFQIKELAGRVGCPAIVAVQARREVDDRDIKIPEMRDAQWASSIEQTADKAFGIWRPWRTEANNIDPAKIAIDGGGARFMRGGYVDVWDQQYILSETLLLMQMLKQRGDSGRAQFSLRFNPAYLSLAHLETYNEAV